MLGFQHALDIVFDFHTTYPPDRVRNFLDEKYVIIDDIIRRTLQAKGLDPDELIEANMKQFETMFGFTCAAPAALQSPSTSMR